MKTQSIVGVRIHHIFALFFFPLLLTLPMDYLKLSRHCTKVASRDSERRFRCCIRDFSKGTASFLTVTVGKVPDSAPFVWLVFVETLKSQLRPSPCRAGETRNFLERAASFLTDTDRRREALVTVFCFVRQEGTSGLVPSYPEVESREILRSGKFLFSGDL